LGFRRDGETAKCGPPVSPDVEPNMNSTFEELILLAERLGIAVRHAHLGGLGGGLAAFKGKRQLFIDLDADPADQLEQTAKALATVQGLADVFIRPDVRELIEQARAARD
jgi:hypothetical protein